MTTLFYTQTLIKQPMYDEQHPSRVCLQLRGAPALLLLGVCLVLLADEREDVDHFVIDGDDRADFPGHQSSVLAPGKISSTLA